VNLYKQQNNTQFILHNSVFIIKFQFVLHVPALFLAILGDEYNRMIGVSPLKRNLVFYKVSFRLKRKVSPICVWFVIGF